ATKRGSSFSTPAAFRDAVEKNFAVAVAANPEVSERDLKRTTVSFCRSAGQIPERTIRSEFMKLTKNIGCPEFTRVHDLRHLFSSRAQAAGMNPILVQEMLGHTTLDMTRRYTHLGMETKRAALESLIKMNSCNAG